MNREERYKLNEERQEIEGIIHALAALHHASKGDCELSQEQKDNYLDIIRGHDFTSLAYRYIEIQNIQWADFTGRPIPGGEPNLSTPN
jgi:hypothetical protein